MNKVSPLFPTKIVLKDDSQNEPDEDWTNKEFLKKRQKELATTPINEPAMIEKMMANPTVQLFCTNDLRKERTFTKKKIILISNYTFILRLAIMHIIIVGMPYLPIL